MEKEFISREQALALKKLGFDGPYLAYYTIPLYQQAFRWFRDKHHLDSFIKPSYKLDTKKGYYFCFDGYVSSGYFKTYEEAEKACLDKLIEIVKNGNTRN